MKINTIIIMVILSVSIPLMVIAGSIDSSAPPASTSSYTLDDIYNRLNTGATGSQSMYTEPTSGPTSGTMHTLNEIMSEAPAPDNTNGAATGDVLSGKTFWGLRTDGSWGLQTGTLATSQARFTDNGDGTVTENNTGLIWLRNADCANTTTTRDNSHVYITELNNSGTMNGNNCGDISNGGSHQTDWRLPEIFELTTLVNRNFTSPALSNSSGTAQWTNGDPFINVRSPYGAYLSSTYYYQWPILDYSFILRFDDGDPAIAGAKTYECSIWPVRDAWPINW